MAVVVVNVAALVVGVMTVPVIAGRVQVDVRTRLVPGGGGPPWVWPMAAACVSSTPGNKINETTRRYM